MKIPNNLFNLVIKSLTEESWNWDFDTGRVAKHKTRNCYAVYSGCDSQISFNGISYQMGYFQRRKLLNIIHQRAMESWFEKEE